MRILKLFSLGSHSSAIFTAEEESEEESEEEEEEEVEPAPTDGLQTPSGMETPSGMASVVSTVAGGLETPDFLELRKNATRAPSEAVDSAPRSLYQVVPEKQAAVRGLMGSERGYDVSAVTNAGAAIPVLGDERGTKVRLSLDFNYPDRANCCSVRCSERRTVSKSQSMRQSWRACPKKSCAASTTSTRVALRG